MEKIVEVLVASMNQTGSGLYEKMNLQTPAVIANQAGEFSYREFQKDGGLIRMITTSDRGVGKNRNIALMYATGDYLVLADDDMVYKDHYDDLVRNAFESLPQADIIVFELRYLNRFTQGKKPNTRVKRVRVFNAMRYGASRTAIRRDSLLKSNLWFSVLYGGGAPFSCGEDTLFLREALRKGMRIYASPMIIADVRQEASSWFKGYTEKFFIDKGIWIANAFPRIKLIIALYFVWKYRKTTPDKNIFDIIKLIFRGIRTYKKLEL